MYISKPNLARVKLVFKAILDEVKNKESDVLTQYDYSSDYSVSICLTVAEIREVQRFLDLFEEKQLPNSAFRIKP